jgi:ABC-type glycerol-3-phosphate transport system substrate-binding protein
LGRTDKDFADAHPLGLNYTVGSGAPDGSLAARRWNLLEEAKEAALIPPRHPKYPPVEDAIWQGIREAILGHKGAEEALRQTEAAAGRAAEGIR